MAISAYDTINPATYNPMQNIPYLIQMSKELEEDERKLSEEYINHQGLLGEYESRLIQGIDDSEIQKIRSLQKDIDIASENLANKGYIDSGRRRALNLAKSRYAKEVRPTIDIINKREELAKIDREMKLKDPTYRSKNPYSRSISEYSNNRELFNQTGVSGKYLKDQVDTIARSFQDIITKGNLDSISKDKLLYQYEQSIKQGLSHNDAMMVALGEPSDNPEIQKLQGAIQQVMDNSGAEQMFGRDSEDYNFLRNYAGLGAYSSVGPTKYQNYDDSFAMRAALAGNKGTGKGDGSKAEVRMIGDPTTVSNPYNTGIQKEKTSNIVKKSINNPEYLYDLVNKSDEDIKKEVNSIRQDISNKNRQSSSITGSAQIPIPTEKELYEGFKQDQKTAKELNIIVDRVKKEEGFSTYKQALEFIQQNQEETFRKYGTAIDTYSDLNAKVSKGLLNKTLKSTTGKNFYDEDGKPLSFEQTFKDRGWKSIADLKEWVEKNSTVKYNNQTGKLGIEIPEAEYSGDELVGTSSPKFYQFDYSIASGNFSKERGDIRKSTQNFKPNSKQTPKFSAALQSYYIPISNNEIRVINKEGEYRDYSLNELDDKFNSVMEDQIKRDYSMYVE